MAIETVDFVLYSPFESQQNEKGDDHDSQTQGYTDDSHLVYGTGKGILVRIADSSGNKKGQVQEYD